jgi:hypothetical protein
MKAPLAFQLQVLSEAMLAEIAYGEPATAMLAVLVHDTFTADIHLVPIPRRGLAEFAILDRVDDFWRILDAGRQPDMIPGEDGETLDGMYPQDDGTEIDLRGNNELPALFDERQRLGKETRDGEARREEIKDVFRAAMGAHAYARLADGRRVSFKMTRKGSYTVKESEFRTLRLAKG